MGGSHGGSTNFQKPLQNRHSQGCTFLRVGTCAQLVQKQQVFPLHLPQNLHNVSHMGREGGQTLLNALLVSDVSVDILIDRQFGVWRRRQIKARLSHEHQKPQRLHADSLAARIGTCDQQHAVIRAQHDVNGHHLLLINERVAGLLQYRAPLIIELGTGSLHLTS